MLSLLPHGQQHRRRCSLEHFRNGDCTMCNYCWRHAEVVAAAAAALAESVQWIDAIVVARCNVRADALHERRGLSRRKRRVILCKISSVESVLPDVVIGLRLGIFFLFVCESFDNFKVWFVCDRMFSQVPVAGGGLRSSVGLATFHHFIYLVTMR